MRKIATAADHPATEADLRSTGMPLRMDCPWPLAMASPIFARPSARRRSLDLKIKSILAEPFVDQFEVPPLLGIGAEAGVLHDPLQHLTVAKRDLADARV